MGNSLPPLAVTLQPLGEPPRSVFGRLRAMGFAAVQLSAAQPGLRPRELDGSARRDLLATLRRHELSVSGIDAFIPPAHFTADAHVDRAIDAVGDAISLAADLGRCPVCLTLPVPGRDDENDSRLSSVREAIVEAAQRSGIALADHAVPPVHDDLIGIGIDPVAWLAAGLDPAQAVSQHASRVAAVRLADLLTSGMRGPIGDQSEGRLDVQAYRVAIELIEPALPIVLDARQWIDPWKGIAQSKEAWARFSIGQH